MRLIQPGFRSWRGYEPGMDLPSSSRVEVVGCEELAEQLLKLDPPRVGYVTIERSLDRNGHEPLGKRLYTRADLQPYLPDADDQGHAPDEPDDDDGWTSGAFDDEPDEPEHGIQPAASAPPTEGAGDGDDALDLVRGVVAWLHTLAEEQTNAAGGEVTLRLKVWSLKGLKMIYSKRLRATPRPQESLIAVDEDDDRARAPGLLSDEADLVEPDTWRAMNSTVRTLLKTAMLATNSVMSAQGEQGRMTRTAYTAGLRALQDAFDASRRASREDLAAMRETHKATVAHLNQVVQQQARQLADAYQRIDGLVGETLGFRIDLADLGVHQTRSAEDRKVVADLGKNFMDQAGNLAQLWLASKTGMMFDPELIELLKVVQEDDKLRTALKNPKLLALLKNPELRAVFVTSLNDAADALFGAMNDTTPPTDSTPT